MNEDTKLIIIIVIVIVLIILVLDVNYFYIPRHLTSYQRAPKDVLQIDYYYNYKPRVFIDGRVVISLTTIPDRINQIAPTIYLLLSQSRKVDEIRINIPYYTRWGQVYIIPRWLEQCHNVKIYRVDKDLGPSTKLLPTIKDEAPDTHIIVVDDDIVHGPKMVQNIVRTFRSFNYKAAVTPSIK